jgi:hypothetical protein
MLPLGTGPTANDVHRRRGEPVFQEEELRGLIDPFAELLTPALPPPRLPGGRFDLAARERSGGF